MAIRAPDGANKSKSNGKLNTGCTGLPGSSLHVSILEPYKYFSKRQVLFFGNKEKYLYYSDLNVDLVKSQPLFRLRKLSTYKEHFLYKIYEIYCTEKNL